MPKTQCVYICLYKYMLSMHRKMHVRRCCTAVSSEARFFFLQRRTIFCRPANNFQLNTRVYTVRARFSQPEFTQSTPGGCRGSLGNNSTQLLARGILNAVAATAYPQLGLTPLPPVRSSPDRVRMPLSRRR